MVDRLILAVAVMVATLLATKVVALVRDALGLAVGTAPAWVR